MGDRFWLTEERVERLRPLVGGSTRGYDADWLRDELRLRRPRICIPAQRGRRRPASHTRRLAKKRCRIESALARFRNRRGIATRTTRCADLFLSAICLAATVPFWLPK